MDYDGSEEMFGTHFGSKSECYKPFVCTEKSLNLIFQLVLQPTKSNMKVMLTTDKGALIL